MTKSVEHMGHKVIENIIKGNLVSGKCTEDPGHDVILIWSSGAAEQIEAMIASYLTKENEVLRQKVDKWKTECETLRAKSKA